MAILNTGSVAYSWTYAPPVGPRYRYDLTGLAYADYTVTTTNTHLTVSGRVYVKATLVGKNSGSLQDSNTVRVFARNSNLTSSLGTVTKSFSNANVTYTKDDYIGGKGLSKTASIGTFSITVPKKNTAQTFTFTLSSAIELKGFTAGNRTGTTATITVPAFPQPTFDNDPMTFDTSFDAPYANVTTASVNMSNMTAYDGATITKAVLTIGNQSDTLTGATSGTLSIFLEQVGTFTPTLTVRDSHGQFKTIALPAITIKGYAPPEVVINSFLRTDENGEVADEGMCAVVTASFTWVPITSLVQPTAVVKTLEDVTVQTEITWYTDRSLQHAISDWSTVSVMPIYGFVGNSNTPPDPFDTQESYNLTLTPNDSEGAGTPVVETLGAAFYTVDFLAGGHGIAFGKPSETQDLFECNLNAQFNRDLYLGLDTTDPPDTTTTDGQIYQALKDLGWDSDVIV